MATVLRAHSEAASWRDYLELTKPRVVLLMLITSLVGMFLATRAGVPWTVLLFGNFGIGLCAGAAAAVIAASGALRAATAATSACARHIGAASDRYNKKSGLRAPIGRRRPFSCAIAYLAAKQ